MTSRQNKNAFAGLKPMVSQFTANEFLHGRQLMYNFNQRHKILLIYLLVFSTSIVYGVGVAIGYLTSYP